MAIFLKLNSPAFCMIVIVKQSKHRLIPNVRHSFKNKSVAFLTPNHFTVIELKIKTIK